MGRFISILFAGVCVVMAMALQRPSMSHGPEIRGISADYLISHPQFNPDEGAFPPRNESQVEDAIRVNEWTVRLLALTALPADMDPGETAKTLRQSAIADNETIGDILRETRGGLHMRLRVAQPDCDGQFKVSSRKFVSHHVITECFNIKPAISQVSAAGPWLGVRDAGSSKSAESIIVNLMTAVDGSWLTANDGMPRVTVIGGVLVTSHVWQPQASLDKAFDALSAALATTAFGRVVLHFNPGTELAFDTSLSFFDFRPLMTKLQLPIHDPGDANAQTAQILDALAKLIRDTTIPDASDPQALGPATVEISGRLLIFASTPEFDHSSWILLDALDRAASADVGAAIIVDPAATRRRSHIDHVTAFFNARPLLLKLAAHDPVDPAVGKFREFLIDHVDGEKWDAADGDWFFMGGVLVLRQSRENIRAAGLALRRLAEELR